jgi:hypothetical protein
MALASLCTNLNTSLSRVLRFQAFIVDHGARPGSHEEAQAVSEVLKSKGVFIFGNC